LILEATASGKHQKISFEINADISRPIGFASENRERDNFRHKNHIICIAFFRHNYHNNCAVNNNRGEKLWL
jgi:hypothetical protein